MIEATDERANQVCKPARALSGDGGNRRRGREERGIGRRGAVQRVKKLTPQSDKLIPTFLRQWRSGGGRRTPKDARLVLGRGEELANAVVAEGEAAEAAARLRNWARAFGRCGTTTRAPKHTARHATGQRRPYLAVTGSSRAASAWTSTLASAESSALTAPSTAVAISASVVHTVDTSSSRFTPASMTSHSTKYLARRKKRLFHHH